MGDNQETSFKPLTISLVQSGLSMPDPAILTKYAAERARLLFGCYRRGDANDPETYVAAITATLARYPEDIIREVTHPANGLPTKNDFLPTVKEVFDACEAKMYVRRRHEEWKKSVEKQLAERAEWEGRRKA
jgi:hypothetical protein